MSTPTVASLCAALDQHLAPYDGFTAPATEVTGVHISELLEPGTYLSGGELLLSTGLALPQNVIGCRKYVGRLIEAGVSALAFGLGPVYQEVPETLVAACRDADLTLLVVPVPTPFLTVSRAYWAAQSRSTEQRLNEAVAAHRALVDAAASTDPVSAILRRLAHIVDGWAALLTTQGVVDQIHPPTLDEDVEALQTEVKRLEGAGVHSSASFSTADHVVVIYPLAVADRIVGYLAAGSPQQIESARRRVVLTAVGLLSLEALRDQRSESASDATRRCIALLVDLGHVTAARLLAAKAGAPVPRQEVVVAAVRGRESGELVRTFQQWCTDALAVMVDRTTAWLVLPDDHPGLDELEERMREQHPDASTAISELVAVSSAGPVRARLQRRLASLKPGQFLLPRPASTEGAPARAVDRFAAEASTELVDALVAFLRCRGHWENASAALGLHRNTLRYRVARARDLLDTDLDDPDVFAEVWLALRARGLA
jgi:purine catabolism regulator